MLSWQRPPSCALKCVSRICWHTHTCAHTRAHLDSLVGTLIPLPQKVLLQLVAWGCRVESEREVRRWRRKLYLPLSNEDRAWPKSRELIGWSLSDIPLNAHCVVAVMSIPNQLPPFWAAVGHGFDSCVCKQACAARRVLSSLLKLCLFEWVWECARVSAHDCMLVFVYVGTN